jgi:hypothetical protein
MSKGERDNEYSAHVVIKQESARKFARIVLEENAREQEFDVELLSADESTEVIADAFREEGCTAIVQGSLVSVTCTPAADLTVRDATNTHQPT